MRRAIFLVFTAVMWLTASASQSVGLVLSGGGAKGIAHIGVIQALEDNDIPIDYIAGTSMGSIVGSLYAMGYTPQEMLELICSEEFQNWSTGTIDRNLTYYYARKPATPKFVDFNLNLGDSTALKSMIPESLINPLPMNYGFLELFSASTAQCGGDFDRLFVPFRCVTSDVYDKRKIVLRSGDLGQAVRSSMSFPLVFRPIMIDSIPMLDGGIYDNYPFDVMNSEFAPDIMLGVDVTSPDAPAATASVIDRIEAMVIQDSNHKMPRRRGMTIRIDLPKFSLLDFNKAQEIYNVGYERGIAMMDSIKSRVTAREPASARNVNRRAYRAMTPDVLFDSVNVTGGTESQNDYIKFLFTKGKSDTLSLTDVRDSYYRAITPGKFSDLMLTAVYKPKTGLFNLNAKADVKNNYRFGLGGYVSSTTNSFLFLSAGYNTLSYNSLDVDVNGWLGQELIAVQANAKIALRTAVPTSLILETQLSRRKWSDKQHLIFDDYLPNSLNQIDNYIRLRYSLATSLSGKVDITAGYGRLTDKFYDLDETELTKENRNRTLHRIGRVTATYDYNRLDNDVYPTTGTRIVGSVGANAGQSKFFPAQVDAIDTSENVKWLDARFDFTEYFNLSKHLTLGIDFEAIASTRKLLPNYMATLAQAPQFSPTPASNSRFNPDFRSFSSVAAGGVVVVPLSKALQVRGNIYGYMPIRKILPDEDEKARFGNWLNTPECIGELNVVYSLPFADISAYANYTTSPADRWSFGVSIGAFIIPELFLR